MKSKAVILFSLATVILVMLSATATAEKNEIVFFDSVSGNEITEIGISTEVYAKVNFTVPESENATLVMAKYNGNGGLTGLDLKNLSNTENLIAGETVTCTTEPKNVSDTEALKVFVWENMKSMKPLTDVPGVLNRYVDGSNSQYEKFVSKFVNADKYLYRVGNANSVAIGSLFGAVDGAEIGNITVTVESADNSVDVSGTYAGDASDWTKGTISFEGTGPVKVTIDDDAEAKELELYLEVVDAVNATTAVNATSNNVVLLNNVSGPFTVSNRYAFYGNGFTVRCAGKGSYGNASGLRCGFITVESGGVLDNVSVICDIYPESYIYAAELQEDSDGGYSYVRPAVMINGNGSKISNCYIYGGRDNIYVESGNVIIENTVTERGSLANVQINKSSSEYTVTLDNLTTIQYPDISPYDTSKTVMGFGVIVGTNDSTSNPGIVIKGDLRQYNWVNDEIKLNNLYSDILIGGALKVEEYQHIINGKKSVNMGIAYLNNIASVIVDERENKDEVPYKESLITISNEEGRVYSIVSESGIDGTVRTDAKADGVIPYSPEKNCIYVPQIRLKSDLGGQRVEKVEGADEYCYADGNTVKVLISSEEAKELDVLSMMNFSKYSGQNLNVNVSCTDKNGVEVKLENGKLYLDRNNEYTLVYSLTDTVFFDKFAKPVQASEAYSFEVSVRVNVNDKNTPDARFEFESEKQKIYYSGYTDNYVQFIPFLAGLKIYDYAGDKEYLRFDGNSDYAKIAGVKIENIKTSGEAEGGHIVTVELVDGAKLIVDMDVRATSGSSAHTGNLKVKDNTLYVVNGGTTKAKGQQWTIYNYSFVGNNGKEVISGRITFGTNGVDAEEAEEPSGDFATAVLATVIYDANGGVCGQTVGYKTSNYTSVILPTPSYAGYLLTGWYTAPEGGELIGNAGDVYTPSSNITLYAQWGEACDVTYESNGGILEGDKVVRYEKDLLVLPDVTLDGFWFEGWYSSDEFEAGTRVGGAGDLYAPAGDITLYARFSKVYTVTFDANGGVCDTEHMVCDGKPAVLPAVSCEGKSFIGWYTSPSGGEFAGNIGDAYTPSDNITLFAHWKEPFTVTYNANGGGSGIQSETYYSDALILPSATKSGYVFTGWYTSASCTEKIGNTGDTYIPQKNITLYAGWRGCVVTYNANGGTCATASQTYAGKALILPSATRSDYSLLGWYTAPSGGTKIGDEGKTYIPKTDITLYAQWESCITAETLITLADGTQKQVQHLTGDEELLVWNLETGKYDSAPIVFIDSESEMEYEVINLEFSDGSEVGVITEHGFFCMDDGKYVYLNKNNAADYIGRSFVAQADIENNTWKTVTLENVSVEKRITVAYSPVTFKHLCYYTDGVLSMPGGIDGLFNIFEVDTEAMAYNKEKMLSDIEKYGLFTYADFENLVTPEAYEAFNGDILKVAIGKGILTFEDIEYLAQRYMPLM